MSLQRVQKFLKEKGIEALLVKHIPSKLFINSRSGSGIYVLVMPQKAVQFYDGRYRCEVAELTRGFENIEVNGRHYIESIIEFVKKEQINTLYVEPKGLSLGEFQALAKEVNTVLSKDWIATIRSVKTNEQIEYVKDVCRMTDNVFHNVLTKIKLGMSEKELSGWINYYAMAEGAEKMSFETIVCSGKRTSLPHGRPTDKVLNYGDTLIMDFGLVHNFYQSDMTRTVFLGEVSAKMRHIYETVHKAQVSAIKAIKVGKKGKEIDAVARQIISDAGYGTYFSHGLGHGIGLGSDLPMLAPDSEMILENGMIMSCEPGIYIPDLGGVRIEDDVLLADDHGQPLNKTAKDLVVLEV